MQKTARKKRPNKKLEGKGILIFYAAVFGIIYFSILGLNRFNTLEYVMTEGENIIKGETESEEIVPVLDKETYDAKMIQLANYPEPEISELASSATSTATSTTIEQPERLWPVADDVYPKAGALLPFNRIVAYYGNFYSTKMGALGEYPEDEALERLMAEVAKWEKADPTTPVIPAIDYIASTAQGSPGADGLYSFRMPDEHIDRAVSMAEKVNGIVILELQIGQSNFETEIPILEKYLKMPQVHLAIDPEFAMKEGQVPGEYIGSVDADDINYASEYLAGLVNEYDLPPKVLVVHRFTHNMVKNTEDIILRPEVQIVIDMDGWGIKEKKIGTYNRVIQPEPVQFTGFKLFYKNDFFEEGSRIMTPEEILELQPIPSFIQYQ
jgi:hypothetical protein